ncbi:MAG: tRNA preQ1(34) S-adenosylmethionine ribosyltransferase-isomerase QueA [Acidimicrobiia bacterium]
MQAIDFAYELPDHLIAQSAIEPRDSSRLLVASTKQIVRFSDLGSLLQPNDLLVVNRTRVRSARIEGVRRGTGGRVEALLVKRIDDTRWEALLRPSRRLRTGEQIDVGGRTMQLVSDPVHGVATVIFEPGTDIESFVEQHGQVPLPPYFSGVLTNAERYQTIFADQLGSAAAPTAALHFTPELVDALAAGGVDFASVDLEVGIDTFRPMAAGDIRDHEMHSERVTVDADAVAAVASAREDRGRVIAVGTTVVRSLESAASQNGLVEPYAGSTDLFITPGYEAKVVDAMITNFHASQTTLLVMISAFLGDEWRELYQDAIDSELRFLSFGDAMFIEIER